MKYSINKEHIDVIIDLNILRAAYRDQNRIKFIISDNMEVNLVVTFPDNGTAKEEIDRLNRVWMPRQ